MPSRGCAGAREGRVPARFSSGSAWGGQAARGAAGAPGARVRVHGCSVACASLRDRAGTMPGL